MTEAAGDVTPVHQMAGIRWNAAWMHQWQRGGVVTELDSLFDEINEEAGDLRSKRTGRTAVKYT
jgi:hypothetical protein